MQGELTRLYNAFSFIRWNLNILSNRPLKSQWLDPLDTLNMHTWWLESEHRWACAPSKFSIINLRIWGGKMFRKWHAVYYTTPSDTSLSISSTYFLKRRNGRASASRFNSSSKFYKLYALQCVSSNTNSVGRVENIPSSAWEVSSMVKLQRVFTFVVAAGGIYAAYLYQGYVSENLSKRRYGENGERFPHLGGLVGIQCLACFVWAFALLLMLETGKDHTYPSIWTYLQPATTNVIGPTCGMLALKNITYPAQVLVKSSKMVPVMIAATLLHRKKFRFIEYVCAAAISAGVGLFAIKSSTKGNSALQSANPALGYSLVLLNLALDAYTNATQDKINETYKKNTALHMMCWMNFWGALLYSVFLFGITSQGADIVAFCTAQPEAAWDVLLFCICGALGQLFIFFTIHTFGSLVCTMVCTTRKFFSILVSVMFTGTMLNAWQWFAVGLVFFGLLYKTVVNLATRKQVAGDRKKEH